MSAPTADLLAQRIQRARERACRYRAIGMEVEALKADDDVDDLLEQWQQAKAST